MWLAQPSLAVPLPALQCQLSRCCQACYDSAFRSSGTAARRCRTTPCLRPLPHMPAPVWGQPASRASLLSQLFRLHKQRTSTRCPASMFQLAIAPVDLLIGQAASMDDARDSGMWLGVAQAPQPSLGPTCATLKSSKGVLVAVQDNEAQGAQAVKHGAGQQQQLCQALRAEWELAGKP